MSPFQARHPSKKEETGVSDQPHHDHGGWELSTRMPGDLVLHEGDNVEEGQRNAV